MKNSWIQLRDFKKAKTLLILPCNAAACIGNYFKAEYYSKKNWNTWREADVRLHDLRKNGSVVFAAIDSVTLETQPDDPRGAIVFETEMDRVRNEEGEDWGAPSWRWFKPTSSGKWKYLEELTEALIKGVRRIENLGFNQVFTLVNPRGYSLALSVAIDQCNLSDKWVSFRVPAHPRYLLPAVRQIAPIIRAADKKRKLKGGMYFIPDLYSNLFKESKLYKKKLPEPWKKFCNFPNEKDVKTRWDYFKCNDSVKSCIP
ncbi:MAG: hypothetical protein KC733_00720 [Candidatus Omnitrophica bacterium]|nr:hypothetical protein [Candidatus Omnitrophota bacterium]